MRVIDSREELSKIFFKKYKKCGDYLETIVSFWCKLMVTFSKVEVALKLERKRLVTNEILGVRKLW